VPTAIRTFFVIAKRTRLNTQVAIAHRAARASPSLTQDQRLAWIRELLTGASESLPYRVAGLLLLLYAQPLVKVVTLRLDRLDDRGPALKLTLGKHPVEVPEPFAEVLRPHVANRPNLRTGGGVKSPWLFPSSLAGRQLHPNSVMVRLRGLARRRQRRLLHPPRAGNLAGVSDQVLDALAQALRLDDAERSHLFDLARASTGPVRGSRRAAVAKVRPGVLRILESLNGPAYVRNARMDILAANDSALALYDGVLGRDRLPLNLARFLFLDDRAPTFLGCW